jgi:hypothetical protein
MCCCVADAITTEHKFLKRHNEKFESLSTSVGQVWESLETIRRAFCPRPTSMIVRSFPRATKSKRKTGALVVKNRLISRDGTTSRWKFFFVAWKARRSRARARNQIRINAFNHSRPSVREVLNPPQRYGDEFPDRSTFGPPEDTRPYVNLTTILLLSPRTVRAPRRRPRYRPPGPQSWRHDVRKHNARPLRTRNSSGSRNATTRQRWKTQKRNDSLVAPQMLTTRPFALQRRAEPVYKKNREVTCRTPNQPPDKTVGSPIR